MSTTGTDVRGPESTELYRLEIVVAHMKELLRDAYRKLVTVDELIRLEGLPIKPWTRDDELARDEQLEDRFGRHPGLVRAFKVFMNEMREVDADPIEIAAEAAVNLQGQLDAAEMSDRPPSDTRAYGDG